LIRTTKGPLLAIRHGSHNQKTHGHRGVAAPTGTSDDGIVRTAYGLDDAGKDRALLGLLQNTTPSKLDPALAHIQAKKGYNGKPQVVSSAQLDQHVKNGEIELHRGVQDKAHADQFREGALFTGKGVFGSGTYAASGMSAPQIADGYARKQNDGKGVTMRMTLKKNARVIDVKELSNLELNRAIATQGRRSTQEILATSNKGRFAALLGYDAVRLKPSVYLLLNRTALRVADTDHVVRTITSTALIERLLRHGSHNQKTHGHRGVSAPGGEAASSKVTGGDPVSETGIVRKPYGLDEARNDPKLLEALRTSSTTQSDAATAYLQAKRGYNGKPDVVSRDALDKHIADGEVELYRGVATKSYANDIRDGQFYVGAGVYGHGMYTASGKEGRTIAEIYGDTGAVVRMSLKKDAKVIDEVSLRVAGNAIQGKTPQEILSVSERGRLAVLLGYDAISVRNSLLSINENTFYIVVNRTAVRVQATNVSEAATDRARVMRHGSHNQKTHGFRGGTSLGAASPTGGDPSIINRPYDYTKDTALLGEAQHLVLTSGREKGDLILQRLQAKKGYNGKPDVVSKSELDAHIANGELELHRGVAKEAFADDFRAGPLYAGRGISGSGTYTAADGSIMSGRELARHYATGVFTSNPLKEDGVILRMSLKKGANVSDETTLRNLQLRHKAKASSAEKEVINDLGRFAATQGYDAYRTEGFGMPTYVILNRTALRVQTVDLAP
jgi:hypothetical protein